MAHDPDEMTAMECLYRAKKCHNNGRINESPLYWIDQAIDKLDAVGDDIEERIEEIESDSRYETGEDAAEVQVNAVLALMQSEWCGEVKGLKRAQSELDDLR